MVATDMCGKSPSRGSGYNRLCENILLTILFIFNTLSFTIIVILLFLLVYIPLLMLSSLLKLLYINLSLLSLLLIDYHCYHY